MCNDQKKEGSQRGLCFIPLRFLIPECVLTIINHPKSGLEMCCSVVSFIVYGRPSWLFLVTEFSDSVSFSLTVQRYF